MKKPLTDKQLSHNKIIDVRLEVFEDNVNAIKAYEKLGFKRYSLTMQKLMD
jgi:ribosomal protein S18 acetylase RimI-like enzyme